MKKLLWFICIFSAGCGGSLTSEQREEMKEARRTVEIKRVTEAEILEAGLDMGRKIATLAGRVHENPGQVDSLASAGNVVIKWIAPGAGDAREMEKQVIEAYIMHDMTGELPDNIQMIGADTLMYTKPVVQKLPGGAVEVQGMWSILLPKKEVVLSIDK